IIDAYDVVISKIKLLLETNITDEEKKVIINFIKKINKTVTYYKNQQSEVLQRKFMISQINIGIERYLEHMKSFNSEIQNFYTSQDSNIESLSQTIANLIKYKNQLSEYNYKIAEKDIETSYVYYGKYKFVKKFA